MSQKSKYAVTLATFAFTILLTATVIKNVQSNASSEKKNLMDFAYANCMFWYFKSKKYDTKDIRAISGGYVEMGSSSADKYQEIALFIKNYKTSRKTKHDTDPELLKCFHLDENTGLLNLINEK